MDDNGKEVIDNDHNNNLLKSNEFSDVKFIEKSSDNITDSKVYLYMINMKYVLKQNGF